MHEAVSKALFDEAVRGMTTELCAARGWKIHSAEFPILDLEFGAIDRQSVRIRARCDEWNDVPVSIEWLDANGKHLNKLPHGPGNQLNSSPHPSTGRPFVCMAGVREYHSHPSHTGDIWENYKEKPGYDLGGIVTQIWRAWQEARP